MDNRSFIFTAGEIKVFHTCPPAESWNAEQIEAWEHDQWLMMQEMGDDYYKLHRRHNQGNEEEDPFE